MNYRLGRKAVKQDSRTLQFRKYLGVGLPAPPVSRDWTAGVTAWGMMLNDQLGDCTIAGAAHAIQLWSKNASTECTLADADVLAAYEAWDGYKPGDPETDNGGIELDVLNNWRKSSLAGHTLLAFASVRPTNAVEVRQAINLFGGLYIGLDLPATAQGQAVWDVDLSKGPDSNEGSWGGHCVYVAGYDSGGFQCITWGAVKRMTPAFFATYCDEAYALLGADWLNAAGEAPAGFNRDELLADLAQIR